MRTTALCGLLLLSACGSCRSTPGGPDASTGVSQAWLDGVPPPDTGAPRAGGTLTVRAMAEPAGLNYLDDAFRDTWTARLTRNLVYESLLEIDAKDYTLKPQLAESFTESDEHHTTRFALRSGVTFHDGSAFTAKDVIAVLDAVKDPKRPTATVRADFVELEKWTAVDERTVELRWRNPSPFALRKLGQLPIYPAAALAQDWAALAQRPIGTGPFRFESWERGSKLVLTRGAWWGGAVPLERIVFRIVKDHTVAAGLFEKGEFDLMTNVQPVLWRSMEAPGPKYAWAQQGYWRLKGIDNSYSFIAWNEALPALADVRVRRALARLYPADVIARVVDLNLELPTTCPFYRQSDKCDPALKPIAFDPPAARAELTDAGFADSDGDGVLDRDGAALRLRFLMPATSVRLGKVVPLLQEQAKPIGVDLVAEKVDVASMTARVNKRDFEVVSRLWTELDLEVDQYQVFHSSQIDGGSNYAGYSSPLADRLMEQIRAEWDPVKRSALERALHRRLYEDQPYLFMTVRQSLDVAKRRVHNVRPSLVWYDLRHVWVDP